MHGDRIIQRNQQCEKNNYIKRIKLSQLKDFVVIVNARRNKNERHTHDHDQADRCACRFKLQQYITREEQAKNKHAEHSQLEHGLIPCI